MTYNNPWVSSDLVLPFSSLQFWKGDRKKKRHVKSMSLTQIVCKQHGSHGGGDAPEGIGLVPECLSCLLACVVLSDICPEPKGRGMLLGRVSVPASSFMPGEIILSEDFAVCGNRPRSPGCLNGGIGYVVWGLSGLFFCSL